MSPNRDAGADGVLFACLEIEDPRSGDTVVVAVTSEQSAQDPRGADAAHLPLRSLTDGDADAARSSLARIPWRAFAGVTFRSLQFAAGASGTSFPRALTPPAWASRPLPLSRVEIPKPWGRELWFTGMEKRGVCEVAGVPLPWLVAAGREEFFGEGISEIVLLKILDPLALAVWGDLYTEIHREKNEVYVCTDVHPDVAKDGAGRLRFGLSLEAWRASGCDEGVFKSCYLAAVKAYEPVRRAIDAMLDARAAHHAQKRGLAPDVPVDVAQLARWHDELPEELRAQEAALRANVEAFTQLHAIAPGDVARVPVGVPHALQAGVRVVEFQTATYERAIVSFAQKVLTQAHWDTEEALALLDVEASLRSPFVSRGSAAQSAAPEPATSERIVDFPAFEVERITEAHDLTLGNEKSYELLFLVSGTFRTGDFEALAPEASLLLRNARMSITGKGVLLRARPRF